MGCIVPAIWQHVPWEPSEVRLYLSSFRMGCCPERLVELAAGARRVAVIANATDGYPGDGRMEAVEREISALTELGFDAHELDLRDHFDTGSVATELRACDVVWVRGGNVFGLRYALSRSGADEALTTLLREDLIVYGGYSAGPCVLAPTLRGFESVDEPAAVEQLYGAEPIWDGLGILDYSIVPHVDSPEHPESQACNRLAEEYHRTGRRHRTLRDGEVLIVDGAIESVCR